MFKILYNIIAIAFSFIALIISFFIAIIKILISPFTSNSKKPVKVPVKKTFKHKQRIYEYDKENNIWHLSEEEKNIAKDERMSYADYIEAEERDDDNLDNDE